MIHCHRAAAVSRWVFLCAVIAVSASHAGGDAVDEYVRREMERRHIPGVAVGVRHEGTVVKLAGYGKANVELDVAVTLRTVFQIQSVTKTFTATAVLMLVEEGKLALGDPVATHLDGTPETWKEITIRHLLSHTSGIKDFINEPTAGLRLDVTEEEVLGTTAPRPLNFPPGERYAYSNTNYHLLAMIIRKITGQWYGDVLKERIFTPLGMADTRIVSHGAIIPNRAAGYRWRDNTLRNGEYIAESILGYGGGGIVSTAADMVKYAAAFESAALLGKETIEQAWTPATLNNGKKASYGLGWAMDSVNGHRGFGHGGKHATGFTSYLLIHPDDALAVVVLANSNDAATGRMAHRIAGLFVPGCAPQRQRPIPDREPEVSALVRECLAGMATGNQKEERFTPEMWKVVVAQQPVMQPMAVALGRIEAVELLGREQTGDLRTYRYRATCANGSLSLVLVLEKDGRIAGATVEEE